MALMSLSEAGDEMSLVIGNYIKLYNTVVNFKDSLAKVFWEKGFMTESSKLDAFKTVAIETHTNIGPQIQQLSTDVLLVFNLISEIIRATIVNESKARQVVSKSDSASQTERVTNKASVPSNESCQHDPTPHQVKKEKNEEVTADSLSPADDADNIDDNDVPPTPPPSTPLRKSSRTSVINRKPFAKPPKQKAAPGTVVGAKKRKQGRVAKVLKGGSTKSGRKRALSAVGNQAEDVGEVDSPKLAKRARRAPVLATNLYFRTAEGLFRCKECGKESKLQTNIRKHLRKHTGENPFPCSRCSETFAHLRDLNRHSQTHSDSPPTEVGEAPDKPILGDVESEASVKGDDWVEGFDEANVNSMRSAVSMASRTRGLKRALKEETLKEELCGEEEEEEPGGTDTVPAGSMYEVTKSGLYRCIACGRETKDRSNIRKHFLKWHAGAKRYACTKCSKAFSFPESLKHHQKVHVDPSTLVFEKTAEGTYRCKQCEHESRNRSNIVKHVKRRHLHAGEKPYECALCPAVFAYPRSLKRHEMVHKGIRPFSCAMCDKSFFDSTALRSHTRVHTNDRPYVCQICGNRFRQKEGLKGHMRRHTGDRPYVCERCGMAFAAKRSLTRHIRVHTGERPYPCDQCVAAFADWTTLHNHKMVHRDENAAAAADPGDGEGKEGEGGGEAGSENKPYQCQFCGIRYRQPLSLKRHLRLHSPNAPLKKAAVKKSRQQRLQDGDVEDAEESTALHLQYRPYQCQLCGEKFKHLRGYNTHKAKHENGTFTAKKSSTPRRPRPVPPPPLPQPISTKDIEQAATILASVAVNNAPVASAGEMQLSVLNAAAAPSETVTVIDAATMNSISIPDPSCGAQHLTVTDVPAVSMSTPADVIHYASDNVTQVIRYPDGTLSHVTALVPHTPAQGLMQPVDLLDNMVTVVFETNNSNVVVNNQ